MQHLKLHGCELLREGGRHSVYVNRRSGKASTVPRHAEVDDCLAKRVCKDLEIPQP